MIKKLLDGFGAKNFRLFNKYIELDFKNISILTGPNNSGKSSLIKALLLLYHSQEKWDKRNLWGSRLNFHEKSHELSGIKTTLNNEEYGITLSVKNGIYSYCYEFDNKGELYYNYKICKNGQLVIQQAGGNLQVNFSQLIKYLEYLLIFDYEQKNTIVSLIDSLKKYIASKPDFINIYFEETNDSERLLPKISYDTQSVLTMDNSSYFNEYSGLLTDFGIEEADEEQELTVKWLFSEIVKAGEIESEIITYLFPPINPSYEFMPEIFYLPSSKGIIKRSYSDNDSDMLKDIIKQNIISYGNISYSAFAERNLLEEGFVKKWLKEFGIGLKLKPDYDEVTGSYFITINGRSIVDYGIGVAQIVTMLIWISNIRFSFQRNSKFKPLIILEEPESNLHPALQSKLMEFIIELSQEQDLQFIIETHSEYLIRKLQYLTAKKKIKPEDSVIYYFHHPDNIPEGEEQVKKLEIREDGGLTGDFGPGFFDEATNLKFELLKLKNPQKN